MQIPRKLSVTSLMVLFVSSLFLYVNTASAGLSGAIYTTVKDGTIVNKNIYGSTEDVYLSGGPQNLNAAGLPDGTYYFQVTDPSGKTLLSTDEARCRQLIVTGGRVTGSTSTGPPCAHALGTFDPANGATPVQLAPFSKTPNNGNEYKARVVPVGSATIGADLKTLNFSNANSKTDNFKAQAEVVVQGSCQPSSSLSVLVSGTNVVAYVPKGNWSVSPTTGVAAVNVEGTSITDTLIPTGSVVNSCASNPITGQTVCTANNTDVYIIKGTALDPAVATNPLTSAGSGSINFSGGSCTNCGVAMDATHNKAVIGLSLAGAGGFQFLNLGSSPVFEPAFASLAPSSFFANISEDPLIDPIRNLLLSAAETSNYEIIDVTTSTAPAFFENAVVPFKELDSSGEDCSTGIVLAPAEFSGPSEVFIADISNPAFASFTPGSPGTWTAPSQVQSLSESNLFCAGASGIAVAQGTHTGVVTDEFGCDNLTAIALPAVSGGGAVPAISDWITCNIGGGFSHGFDPHTVTAYQSPTNGHAIALLANGGATMLAVVDLTNMLDTTIVPRTGAGHGCASGPLPASVVTFIAVP